MGRGGKGRGSIAWASGRGRLGLPVGEGLGRGGPGLGRGGKGRDSIVWASGRGEPGLPVGAGLGWMWAVGEG